MRKDKGLSGDLDRMPSHLPRQPYHPPRPTAIPQLHLTKLLRGPLLRARHTRSTHLVLHDSTPTGLLFGLVRP